MFDFLKRKKTYNHSFILKDCDYNKKDLVYKYYVCVKCGQEISCKSGELESMKNGCNTP